MISKFSSLFPPSAVLLKKELRVLPMAGTVLNWAERSVSVLKPFVFINSFLCLHCDLRMCLTHSGLYFHASLGTHAGAVCLGIQLGEEEGVQRLPWAPALGLLLCDGSRKLARGSSWLWGRALGLLADYWVMDLWDLSVVQQLWGSIRLQSSRPISQQTWLSR